MVDGNFFSLYTQTSGLIERCLSATYGVLQVNLATTDSDTPDSIDTLATKEFILLHAISTELKVEIVAFI